MLNFHKSSQSKHTATWYNSSTYQPPHIPSICLSSVPLKLRFYDTDDNYTDNDINNDIRGAANGGQGARAPSPKMSLKFDS